MYPIIINGNTVPTNSDLEQPALQFTVSTVAEPAIFPYFFIQTKEPVHPQEKDALRKSNVRILEVIARNTYLCTYADKASKIRPSVKELRASLKFIIFADVYRSDYVLDPSLKLAISKDGKANANVDIVPHRGVSACDLADQVAARAGVPIEDVFSHTKKLQLRVMMDQLADLASVEDVKSISTVPTCRPLTNVATGILRAHKPVGWNDKVYKGAGQVVCVADTGFDTGLPNNCHEAFGNRVLKVIPYGSHTSGEDLDGHGTHVCGSVIGNGVHLTEGKVEAPASEAKLIVQTVFGKWKDETGPPSIWQASLTGIPRVPSDLLWDASEEGAHIHSNSWGTFPGTNGATGIAADIDEYLWADRDLVVLFGAGNEGVDIADGGDGKVDPESLGAQAEARNVITVGASESQRPNLMYPLQQGVPSGPRIWGYFTQGEPPTKRFPLPPLTTDGVADNPEGLAALSSRGPTVPDGRIKPDVVAPGTAILSTRSQKIIPGHETQQWGISDDPKWCYMGGTSMATPLVAGCCAVVRGAMVENGSPSPSAATVKAVIINGAVPLKGQYTISGGFSELSPPPNSDYGFGRVDLHNSLLHVVPSRHDRSNPTAGFGQGPVLNDDGVSQREWTRNITIPNNVTPREGETKLTLKVTIVWADKPGPHLQNDLDLSVSQGNEVKYGNGGTSPDRLNNVEQVSWQDVEPSQTYTIRVLAFSIPGDDGQDFAYAWMII